MDGCLASAIAGGEQKNRFQWQRMEYPSCAQPAMQWENDPPPRHPRRTIQTAYARPLPTLPESADRGSQNATASPNSSSAGPAALSLRVARPVPAGYEYRAVWAHWRGYATLS